MAYTIAVAGKGGTGKSTISALLIEYLKRNNKGPILAIDADPNISLNQLLGVELSNTLVGILDNLAAKRDNMPAGVSKNAELEYEVQDSLSEADGYDLLAMGRPEGPGCYCYANTVLRNIIEKLTKSYSMVVIDNEAGMEHLSRRTARRIDLLYVVSNFSRVGIRSAKRIMDLAGELKLDIKKSYLILNMAGKDTGALDPYINELKLEVAGFIPYSKQIEAVSVEGKPVSGLPEDSDILRSADEIFKKTIGG